MTNISKKKEPYLCCSVRHPPPSPFPRPSPPPPPPFRWIVRLSMAQCIKSSWRAWWRRQLCYFALCYRLLLSVLSVSCDSIVRDLVSLRFLDSLSLSLLLAFTLYLIFISSSFSLLCSSWIYIYPRFSFISFFVVFQFLIRDLSRFFSHTSTYLVLLCFSLSTSLSPLSTGCSFFLSLFLLPSGVSVLIFYSFSLLSPFCFISFLFPLLISHFLLMHLIFLLVLHFFQEAYIVLQWSNENSRCCKKTTNRKPAAMKPQPHCKQIQTQLQGSNKTH